MEYALYLIICDCQLWVRSARVLSEKELEEEAKRKMNELANRANKRKK